MWSYWKFVKKAIMMSRFVLHRTLWLKDAEWAKRRGRGPGKRLLLEPRYVFMVAYT